MCPWISDLLKSLMDQHPDTWEEQIPKFLFDFRNKACSNSNLSPFYIMYGRSSIPQMTEENKENHDKRYSRRLRKKVVMVRKIVFIFHHTVARL